MITALFESLPSYLIDFGGGNAPLLALLRLPLASLPVAMGREASHPGPAGRGEANSIFTQGGCHPDGLPSTFSSSLPLPNSQKSYKKTKKRGCFMKMPLFCVLIPLTRFRPTSLRFPPRLSILPLRQLITGAKESKHYPAGRER
jgi:hypothetical protein